MRQQVKSYHLMGGCETAEIVIDKNGMRIENKSNQSSSDDEFYRAFITRLIDLDGWNYSWHISVDNAKSKSREERKKIRDIMQEKIKQREAEIQELKNGIQVLGRWKY